MVASRALATNSRDHETETGNFETEKRVHRIHGTLETVLQIILGNLVAPTRRAGGILIRTLMAYESSGKGWGVGMLRGVGDSFTENKENWFIGLSVFVFLVSWFVGFLVYWFPDCWLPGFLDAWFLGFGFLVLKVCWFQS